jgi:hypothetical protein
MAVRSTPIKALRLFNRLARMPEVQKLSHPAFRWLYGVVTAWTGHNNGSIEFTRRRHAALLALDHPAVFDKARADVLASGLVMRTRIGGRNLADHYAIVLEPMQVNILGTCRVPTTQKNLGTPDVPTASKTGTSRVPNRYAPRTKENDPYRRSRARLNRTEILNGRATVLTESHVDALPTPDARQGRKLETQHKPLSTAPPLASLCCLLENGEPP